MTVFSAICIYTSKGLCHLVGNDSEAVAWFWRTEWRWHDFVAGCFDYFSRRRCVKSACELEWSRVSRCLSSSSSEPPAAANFSQRRLLLVLDSAVGHQGTFAQVVATGFNLTCPYINDTEAVMNLFRFNSLVSFVILGGCDVNIFYVYSINYLIFIFIFFKRKLFFNFKGF